MKKQKDKTDSKPQAKEEEEATVSFFSHSQLIIWAFILVNAYLSVQQYDQSRELSLEASAVVNALNNTARANPRILFFNRVPKAGTTSVATWLQLLSKKNNFDHYSYRIVDGLDSEINAMDKHEINTTVHYISSSCLDVDTGEDNATCSYYKHIRFIDYTEYGVDANPVYINMVRHPISRMLSWYYYIRSTQYLLSTTDMPPRRLKTSFDECLTKDKDCGISLLSEEVKEQSFIDSMMRAPSEREKRWFHNATHRGAVARHLAERKKMLNTDDLARRGTGQADTISSQLGYFCGFGAQCRTGGDAQKALRLAIAKRNVERSYAVVGVLEDLDVTTSVLEAYIPRFFKGMKTEITLPKVNANKSRPRLSQQAKTMLEDFLSDEIEFYYFCRQRLRAQYNALSLL